MEDTMIFEKEVISIPASGTIDLIYKYGVHAHPVKDKGYNYKSSKYYTFRKEHGVMEKIFSLETTIVLNVKEELLEDFQGISSNQLERLKKYINERKEIFGFNYPEYKFYLLKEEFELENKPALPKRNNHSYFTIDELKNGEISIKNHENYSRKTFLLTYNIDKWQWDNFEEAKNNLIDEGRYIDSWSCGNSKKLRTGDRVFLIKLGKEPRGIMASGLVFDSVYKAPHWNKERRLKGELINYVNVDFDVIRNPVSHEMLLMNQLKEIDPHFKWSSQSSGIEIPSNIAEKLEKLWSEMTGSNISTLSRNEVGTEEIFYPERYTEGALTQITVNKYERNIKARKKCLEAYGYTCKICGENLEDKYGDLGKDFIHVHHIIPLNEIKEEYNVNPLTDLIPICPNCHAIIHRKNPAYTPNEIKAILRK